MRGQGPIKNEDYVVRTGKYAGKTLRHIIEEARDYDWILHIHEKQYITIQYEIINRVRELKRAQETDLS